MANADYIVYVERIFFFNVPEDKIHTIQNCNLNRANNDLANKVRSFLHTFLPEFELPKLQTTAHVRPAGSGTGLIDVLHANWINMLLHSSNSFKEDFISPFKGKPQRNFAMENHCAYYVTINDDSRDNVEAQMSNYFKSLPNIADDTALKAQTGISLLRINFTLVSTICERATKI